LIVLFLLSAVYFVLAGAEQKPDENTLPTDTGTVDEKKLSETDKFRVEQLVDDIHKDLDGWQLWYEEELLEDLLSLSDTLFVYASNVWLRKYYSEDKFSLRQTLDDQMGMGGSSAWTKLRNSVFTRMDRLKIK